MDTVGNIIDKLFTVNLKLIHNTNKPKLDNLQIQKQALMREIDTDIKRIFTGQLSTIDMLRPQHKTY